LHRRHDTADDASRAAAAGGEPGPARGGERGKEAARPDRED
jgi:hypothetical protein